METKGKRKREGESSLTDCLSTGLKIRGLSGEVRHRLAVDRVQALQEPSCKDERSLWGGEPGLGHGQGPRECRGVEEKKVARRRGRRAKMVERQGR